MDPQKIKLAYQIAFKDRFKILEKKDLQAELYHQRYQMVLNQINQLPQNSIILDAGCGDGVLLFRALKVNPNRPLIGLDLSLSSLLSIKKRIEEDTSLRSSSLLLVQGDIECLPMKSQSIDAVVCVETLEHLTNIRLGLYEMRRVLKRGKDLLVTVPSALNLPNLIIVGGKSCWALSLLYGLIKCFFGFKQGYIKHTWKDQGGLSFPHRVYFRWKIVKSLEENKFQVESVENTEVILTEKNGKVQNPRDLLLKLIQDILRKINRVTENLGVLFLIRATQKE